MRPLDLLLVAHRTGRYAPLHTLERLERRVDLGLRITLLAQEVLVLDVERLLVLPPAVVKAFAPAICWFWVC